MLSDAGSKPNALIGFIINHLKLCSLFISVTKSLRKQLTGVRIQFWFTVLEMSGRGHLAPLLLYLAGHREAELHDRTLCKAACWTETGGSFGLDKAVKGTPPVTQLL